MKNQAIAIGLVVLTISCGHAAKTPNSVSVPPALQPPMTEPTAEPVATPTLTPTPKPISTPTPEVPPPTPIPVIIKDQEIRLVGGQLAIGGYGSYDQTSWPGARKNAMTWNDAEGRLWLFGGEGLSEKSSGRLNDLWVFDAEKVQWTWKGGSKNPDEASRDDFPGARTGAVTWTTPDGRLWLFGGFTQLGEGRLGYTQDLWVFDPKLNQWTWRSGKLLDQDNQFVGTGTPTTGTPAGRERAARWIDAEGHFWLFGGQKRNLNTGEILRLSDLWTYDIDTRIWTFVSGSRGTNALSVQEPGARENASTWVDPNGSLWLFGGYGFGTGENPGHLNDLWRFDGKTHQWEFVTGSREVDAKGQWGERKVAQDGQYPSGREAASAWVLGQQQLCLLGGWGYSIYHFVGRPNALQDLWCFDLKTKLWTWIAGNNLGKERTQTNDREKVPGTIGYPGARYGSSIWLGPKAEVYLFGGAGYDPTGRGDLLQDFWRVPLQ